MLQREWKHFPGGILVEDAVLEHDNVPEIGGLLQSRRRAALGGVNEVAQAEPAMAYESVLPESFEDWHVTLDYHVVVLGEQAVKEHHVYVVGVQPAKAAFDGAGQFLRVAGGVAVARVGPLGHENVVVARDALQGAS